MNRSVQRKIICFLILSLLLAATVSAQQPATDLVDIRQSISHLQEQLEFLKELNKQFPDKKLEEVIQKIETRIKKAIHAHENKQRRLALQEINAARRLIDLAMRSLLTGPVVSLREQLEEKIRIAEELLRKHFRLDAQRLLQQAQKNKNQAETALHRRNVAKAVELYRIAIFNVDTALDLLSHDSGRNLIQVLREEKSNFEHLVKRIQNILAQTSQLDIARNREQNLCRELYNQALGQQKKAESAYSHWKLQLAIEHFRWGTRLLLRVLDICGATIADSAVSGVSLERAAREELQHTQEQLRALERSLRDTQQQHNRRIYQQAQKVFSDAMHSFQAGKYSQAITKAKLARKILDQARKLSDRGGGEAATRIEHEMELLKELAASLEKQIEEQENAAASRLLSLSRQYLQRAELSHQRGREAEAVAAMLAAARFALSAKSMLSRDLAQDNLAQEALNVFARFEEIRAELLKRLSGDLDTFSQAWVSLTNDVYQAATDAKASGQHLLLLENSRVGIHLLQRMEKHLSEKGN